MVVTGVESLFIFEPLKLLYCDVDVLVFPVYLKLPWCNLNGGSFFCIVLLFGSFWTNVCVCDMDIKLKTPVCLLFTDYI